MIIINCIVSFTEILLHPLAVVGAPLCSLRVGNLLQTGQAPLPLYLMVMMMMMTVMMVAVMVVMMVVVMMMMKTMIILYRLAMVLTSHHLFLGHHYHWHHHQHHHLGGLHCDHHTHQVYQHNDQIQCSGQC